ncbi:Charged multivesicular body protein 2b [Gracilariopsis chorda]|uniref:Charged multivesicular body protein 2b n=1 Tax=Gracilariopsis chorda TaxID=448386 RepID=A0A2V3IDP2_9FLOR|nr:Charged multivesicular body protein 2b [Gracilariopsis chorda]|eukprot:PXF40172.1 Charged multivesicular body protein 2b [Gracilariopsis chorda]
MVLFGRKKQAQAAPPPPPPPSATIPTSNVRTSSQTARDMARQSDRTINRAQRDMQRERIQLEQRERQIEAEIKKLGRQGRMAEARILAKNLVQVRNAKARTFQASVHAGAIATQARMAATDAKMMEVIGNTAAVMKNANGLNDPAKHMNMLQQYDMHSEKQKLNQEMADEILDSVLGGDEIGAESDDVLNSVLDEIGLEVSSKMGGTPVIRPQPVAQPTTMQPADDQLMARIERLGN